MSPFDHYLGCGQAPKQMTVEEARDKVANIHNDTVAADKHDKHQSPTSMRAGTYDMAGFIKQCIEKYLDFVKEDVTTLTKVLAPCIDDYQIEPEENEERGELDRDAANILTKILYAARIARFDLLWTICSSSRQVKKWNKACDKRFHRLVSCLYHDQHITLEYYVENQPKELKLACFSDADFAGDAKDSKSTSGCYLALVGTHTFIPVSAMSKKQGVGSHSSTESEIVSLEQGLRSEALPE